MDTLFISQLIYIVQILVLVLFIGKIVFIDRNYFDPRIYVAYGLFHWLFVSQALFVFDLSNLIGFDPYPPKHFTPEKILIGSSIVFASLLSFFAAYELAKFAFPVKKVNNKKGRAAEWLKLSLKRINTSALIRRSLLLGYMGGAIVSLYEVGALDLPVVLLLPLGYTMASAGIVLAFVVVLNMSNLIDVRASLRFLVVVFFIMFVSISNIAVIYPLATFSIVFALIYISRLSFLKLTSVAILFPLVAIFAMAVQLFWKIYRHVSAADLDSSLINTILSDGFSDRYVAALVTLDSFNSESFAFVLESFDLYADSGNLFYGSTLLSSIPIFKLFPDEMFQSLGRFMARDALDLDLSANTAFAVGPIAEMISNFHFVGPLGFYFVLGLVTRYCYYRFSKSTTFVGVVTYVSFLVWLFVQQRGDFLNGNMYPAYVLLVAYILTKSCLRIFNVRKMAVWH